MKPFEDFLSIFNGITPIIVIIFLVLSHGSYVSHSEYENTKEQIFKRLDSVEILIYKILNNSDSLKASTEGISKNNNVSSE